jgi:maltooligosyltrehalose trehalohydrolase
MTRDEARILINFGDDDATFDLLEGERLELISREQNGTVGDHLVLSPMTLAVLLSTTEETEDRRVASRARNS